MMKNAAARTLPLFFFLAILQFAIGCSSEKQPAQADAAQQPSSQQEAQPGAQQASQQAAQPAAITSGSYAAATQDTSTAPGGPSAYEAANQAKVAERFKKLDWAGQVAAASSPEQKTAILEKRVDELKYNEEYILKYIDKVQQRLETEQDSNFRAGYNQGLEQARGNYASNHKVLEAAQKDLSDSKKK